MEPKQIVIRGASEHNLKNIQVTIPKKKLVVFTGVSGSGKSSLAFDILYAEGQRRYVESLSAYARQFLGQMPKAHFESIRGLSPAISIEQKAASKNPRSTVGTVTEIYDYLRVLYANVGRQHCVRCHQPISRQTAAEIVKAVKRDFASRILLLAPLVENRKGEYKDLFSGLQAEGFSRFRVNGRMLHLRDGIPALNKKQKHTLELVVDRLDPGRVSLGRLTEAVETGLRYGQQMLRVLAEATGQEHDYSLAYACQPCGISYRALSPQSFSFNSPLGMCSACNGLGYRTEVDPDLVVPDPGLSINEGAVQAWGERTIEGEGWDGAVVTSLLDHFGIDSDRSWRRLPKRQKNLILYGTGEEKFKVEFTSKRENNDWSFQSSYAGVLSRLRRKYRETKSERARSWYGRFMREMECQVCSGQRLREEACHVRVGGRTLVEICRLTVREIYEFFQNISLSGNERHIAEEVLKEVRSRLKFLVNVGLDYLTLDRRAPSLSGGESQRIRLASQIGSELSGVMYILDEPSIGLHQRDNARLLASLKHLRNLGNTVIVIEHDEETMRESDTIIDFGPQAGVRGGQVVAAGTVRQVQRCPASLTGRYLKGELCIATPSKRRPLSGRFLEICGAREHNLSIDRLRIPLNQMVCIAGVSGAGKSTLVNTILYPALCRKLYQSTVAVGRHRSIKGLEHLNKVIAIDQKPIGKSSRSNPATYTKVYDLIRDFFAALPESKLRGYRPGRFSFNVKGGRCEVCGGAGVILVEMHFLPDVYVECEECGGKRFNDSTLEVTYKGKNIAAVLDLTVYEAFHLFGNLPRIRRILQTLIDVGMDYVPLGQTSTTLSGGEAQRIKLSRELCKTATGRTLYILDEPTTGLHFDDIRKLLAVLHRLVDQGNSVLIIEHNLDVLKTADSIIDLGPEGGSRGGRIVAQGTPEVVAGSPDSFTGKHLKKVLQTGKNG